MNFMPFEEMRGRLVRHQLPNWGGGVAFITNLLAAIVLAGVAAPAFAFDVSPDPDSTEGSVRIGGHDRAAACGHAKEYRGPVSADRRDEVLLRYGLPAGPHPDYEIDHLIPLCLGGSDDFSNLWPQPRRSVEPKWNAEAQRSAGALNVRNGL